MMQTFLMYIGPGLGAGIVATVLGVIASLFLAVVAILWYPFKRLLARLRKSREGNAAAIPEPQADE